MADGSSVDPSLQGHDPTVKGRPGPALEAAKGRSPVGSSLR
jgi:hypothetical protein